MDEHEEVQQNNMISNLPLLFANGYPTSLDKITETQLENFIPFMVQCSLGHINLQGKIDYSEPEWWPEDLPFYIPFTKPKRYNGNWLEKMKEVVKTCYQFHKSVFLLRFCNDLASYEHASLRFINNYNSTTSLFDRRSNKLLVTFRNENMSYDQPQRMRKSLLQQKTKTGIGHPIMVEPAPFDIYLCDNCDAELYSKEAILEHEKTCNVDDDDDVILCDTPEPEETAHAHHNIHASFGAGTPPTDEDHEQRVGFLMNFGLQLQPKASANPPTCHTHNDKRNNTNSHDTPTKRIAGKTMSSEGGVLNPNTATLATGCGRDQVENGFMIVDKNHRRMPRRNRAVHSLTRCPTIPLSSPAGQLLLRTTKTAITVEYLAERLDRIERFSHAPLLTRQLPRPKYLERRNAPSTPHCTYKKPAENSAHVYVFPRRQFSQRRRTQNFLFINSSLIRRCRPISVRLKKINERNSCSGQASPPIAAGMVMKRKVTSAKLNIKLTRDAKRSKNWKISPSSSSAGASGGVANEIIVDTIDLCSSDEEGARDHISTRKSTTAAMPTSRKTESNYDVRRLSLPLAAVAKATGAPAGLARLFASSPEAAAAVMASAMAVSANVPEKDYLKRIGNRLNTSEVSLIPIRKVLTDYTSTTARSGVKSSLLKIVSTTSGAAVATIRPSSGSSENRSLPNERQKEARGVVSKLDSQALLALQVAAGGEHLSNGGMAPQPLQPSLYILSNYTNSTPLTALVAANANANANDLTSTTAASTTAASSGSGVHSIAAAVSSSSTSSAAAVTTPSTDVLLPASAAGSGVDHHNHNQENRVLYSKHQQRTVGKPSHLMSGSGASYSVLQAAGAAANKWPSARASADSGRGGITNNNNNNNTNSNSKSNISNSSSSSNHNLSSYNVVVGRHSIGGGNLIAATSSSAMSAAAAVASSVGRERSERAAASRGLGLMQATSFGSPGRIISIDLTS